MITNLPSPPSAGASHVSTGSLYANFLYHDVFNLLLAADGRPPRIFNFMHKMRNGNPPSVNARIADIKAAADRMEHAAIASMFDEIWKPELRNAVFHSDYILFENELRIKHLFGSSAVRPPLPTP
ncbi:MAG: hypothetical protein ACOC95_09645 [Planctomycetota bacterium]